MAKEVKTYTLRGASQFLATKGVDVSELRMRTLVRQHEIFTNDPNTAKAATGDTEVQTWRVSEPALLAYAQAAASGNVRTSTGAKAYKITLTTEQLASLRAWASANGVAEPVRANKAYTKKSSAENGAVGSDTIAGEFADDEDAEGLFAEDEVEVDA